MRRQLVASAALAALAAGPAAAQVALPRSGALSNAQPVFCVNPATAAVEDCVGSGGGGGGNVTQGTSPWVDDIAQVGGVNLTVGQTTKSASIPVTIASDQGATAVTGTFWQATQPVSIASMPSTPVTGTFWQTTQPVSLASLPALAAGSNTIGAISNTAFAATQSGTWNIGSISTLPALVAGSAIIGKVGIDQTTPGTTNGVQDAADGATGSAVPSKAGFIGANSSGSLTGLIQADHSAAINISTAATTQLVALSSGKAIYVTHWDVVVGAADNVTLEYGTGTACASGTTTLTGAYNLPANGGISAGVGLAPILVVPAGNALCMLTSAAAQASGAVSYTQF